MENNQYVIGVRNFDGESYVEYDAYIHLAKEMSTKFEKLQKDFARLDKKNKALQDENNALKVEIQRLREKCGEIPADTDKVCVSDDGPDYKKLCRKLQDQHQQDYILINNLNVTIDKLVDRYANLRKNVGMD